MSIKVEIKEIGVKEIQRKMKLLSAAVERRIVRSATSAGANVIKKLAVKNIPIRQDKKLKKVMSKGSKKIKGYRYAGYLKKNIGSVRNRAAPKNVISYLVRPIKYAYYGAFLEVGTKHQSARPWLRPAYESGKSFAIKRMKDVMLKGVDREVLKLSKAK